MKVTTKKDAFISAVLLAVLIAVVFILDRTLPGTSIAMMVLKKGCIYSLVAVSMNLLNGFTGLFSLGQSGFMLVGAYVYAVFTIPLKRHAAVYQYYNGGIIQFELPLLVALLLITYIPGLGTWLPTLLFGPGS